MKFLKVTKCFEVSDSRKFLHCFINHTILYDIVLCYIISYSILFYIILLQYYEEHGVYSSSAKPVAVYLHNLIIDLGLDNEDKIEDVPPQ